LPVRAATSCCKVVQAMTTDGNMWRSQFGKDSNTEAEGRATEKELFALRGVAVFLFCAVVLRGLPFVLRVGIAADVPHPRWPLAQAEGRSAAAHPPETQCNARHCPCSNCGIIAAMHAQAGLVQTRLAERCRSQTRMPAYAEYQEILVDARRRARLGNPALKRKCASVM
jgi:hypothetical protein